MITIHLKGKGSWKKALILLQQADKLEEFAKLPEADKISLLYFTPVEQLSKVNQDLYNKCQMLYGLMLRN